MLPVLRVRIKHSSFLEYLNRDSYYWMNDAFGVEGVRYD